MKRIMINVDDLGLSNAVNEAVLGLAEMQRIHATSFMSSGHISDAEVRALKDFKIDIGLHLDFTGLVKEGNLKSILLRSYMHGWRVKNLRDLICQQLDLFEDQIQSQPVFIDGHQHVHQFPQIRSVLLEQIQHRYGSEVGIRNTHPIQQDLKARIIFALGGKKLEEDLLKQNWLHNKGFGGIYNFDKKNINLNSLWQNWLHIATDQTIIMCHPAIPSNLWTDEIKAMREKEWLWLTSIDFAECWNLSGCHEWHWSRNLEK